MSLIDPVDYYWLGNRIKEASDVEAAPVMSGQLYLSKSGWILLSVPNSLVRGVFDAMQEPGIQLPDMDGKFTAHISVMRKEEVDAIGGPDKITERGHYYSYNIGRLVSTVPLGWDEVSRVWFLRVHSPQLETLRRSYGLTPKPMKGDKELKFHITCAIRRKHILHTNEVSKASGVLAEGENCAHCNASMEKSEDGYCNSCGHDYDTGKVPELGLYHEGKKEANTALVRMIQKGMLSEGAIARAAKAMPEGSFRFLKNLGRGQFNLADKVIGNIEGNAGQLVRKLPTRAVGSIAQEYGPLKTTVDRLNSQFTQKPPGLLEKLRNVFFTSPPAAVGVPPIAPYAGVTERGAFQQLANARVTPPEGLTNLIGDLHKGNIGPRGQILDFSLNHGLAPTTSLNHPAGATSPNFMTKLLDPSGEMVHPYANMPQAPADVRWGRMDRYGNVNREIDPALGSQANNSNNIIRKHWSLPEPQRPGFLNNLKSQYSMTGVTTPTPMPKPMTGMPPKMGESLSFADYEKAAALEGESEDDSDDLIKRADFAPGILAKNDMGDLSKLKAGQIVDMIVQLHNAERAGLHRDFRIGTPETGLYSWATRKELPQPGKRIGIFQQPVHSHEYGQFEGNIPSGYGKGDVKKERQGKLLITKVAPDHISLTTADQRYPERYALINTGKGWLLHNATPTEPTPYQKLRYSKKPTQDLPNSIEHFQPGTSMQAKIDGASSLVRLGKNGLELMSYRTSKETGRPIVHTERVFGGRPDVKIPPELMGTVLKGELYGLNKKNKVVQPQTLGGLLNSTVSNSLATQKAKEYKLRNALFDIQQFGKQHVDFDKVPYAERRKMVEQVMKILPQDVFHMTPEARTKEEAQTLWSQIESGKHPLTVEGVVEHTPHGKPTKYKVLDDHDVHITGIYPGGGKLKDIAAGGFEYSRTPGGPTAGKVGTGFSAATRQDMWQNPQAWIGSVAKVRSQQELASGALRAPAFKQRFVAQHQDYPAGKDFGADLTPEKVALFSELTRRAFSGTPIRYDMNQGLIANMLDHLGKVQQRGQRMVSDARGFANFRSATEPGFGMQRFMDTLNGKPDPMNRLQGLDRMFGFGG